MLQRWLGIVLFFCEQRFRKVQGYVKIGQVMATIEAVHASRNWFR